MLIGARLACSEVQKRTFYFITQAYFFTEIDFNAIIQNTRTHTLYQKTGTTTSYTTSFSELKFEVEVEVNQ